VREKNENENLAVFLSELFEKQPPFFLARAGAESCCEHLCLFSHRQQKTNSHNSVLSK
jgi:hypothetical protein